MYAAESAEVGQAHAKGVVLRCLVTAFNGGKLMLLSVLQATGLDMALNNATAMMTVFVPINAAFDALAMQMNQTLNAIMAQKGTLQQVLPS